MIIDLERFIAGEKQYWDELEAMLDRLDRDPFSNMDFNEIKRFHYLYQRASACLVKVMDFSNDMDISRYLESLVSRAYANVHEIREKPHRFFPLRWFFQTFPSTFRRYYNAFILSLVVTVIGCSMGSIIISIDRGAKEILMPFPHLQADPSERVAQEENAGNERDRLQGRKAAFSAFLMTHNIKVSILTFAMGFAWGIGTIILLFYNGVMLGAVAMDYVLAGQTKFLLAWLLPHGAIEIPAIILAGQAGIMLANAITGRGQHVSLKMRLRRAMPDLVTMLIGLAIMLVWAGIVEAFFSQYHEPVIPYIAKIAFGIVELAALFLLLGLSGRTRE